MRGEREWREAMRGEREWREAMHGERERVGASVRSIETRARPTPRETLYRDP